MLSTSKNPETLLSTPMSVEQPNVIDIISTDRLTGNVVLTVSDHVDWSE